MRSILFYIAAALSGVSASHADVRELSQSELRAAIASDRAIASYRLINGVEDYTGGSVMDMRAFDVDGIVTYRILIREVDGGLGAIMIDANSGRVVMPSTQVGRTVSDYAQVQAATETDETARTQGNVNAAGNAASNLSGDDDDSNRTNSRGNGNDRGNGNSAGGNGNGNAKERD